MQFNDKCVDSFLATNSIADDKTGGTSEQDIDQASFPAEVTPLYGLHRLCGLKGYGLFSAVLVRNRVSILAILVLNRVWFLHSNLELCMFYSFHYYR